MIEQSYYLAGLLVVLGCLALIDYRYKLAFWRDRRATLLTLGVGVAVFAAWDILGINLGIFSTGNSPYILPVRLYKEFPLEELFFLTVLCYQTLLLYLFFKHRPYDRRPHDGDVPHP